MRTNELAAHSRQSRFLSRSIFFILTLFSISGTAGPLSKCASPAPDLPVPYLNPYVNLLQVNPLSPTSPGDLGNTHPGEPVVVDKANHCFRRATSSDDFTHIAFDPGGFFEVGMLARRLRNGGRATCTFTMIAHGYAITAGHCAFEIGGAGRPPVRVADLEDSDRTLALLLTPGAVDAVDNSPWDCFDPDLTCHYVKGKIASVYPPTPFTWLPRKDVPNPDLALLAIQFPDNTSFQPAELTFYIAKYSPITLAGFGDTNRDKTSSNTFLIGWQQVQQLTDDQIIWAPQREGYVSNACRGDSGGPVFLGRRFGAPKEVHQVAGVISQLLAPDSTIRSCLVHQGIAVPLTDRKKWICGQVDIPHFCD